MNVSGEDLASHMAKNLAVIHAQAMKEVGGGAADKLVKRILEAAEHQAWQLIRK